MRLTSSLVLAASCGLAAAHGDGHVPNFVGARQFLSDVKVRRAMEAFKRAPSFEHTHHLQELQQQAQSSEDYKVARANDQGQCGTQFGACPAGQCCSAAGWCGTGSEYCAAPDCQINYGPACDGNQKPSGVDTSTLVKAPRTKAGSVAYGGAGIYDCVTPGDIALTFDDGPYNYTNDLLDKLAAHGAKATFFMTGNNLGKGMINDASKPWPAVIKRMAAEGHQIASHTWSHENASQLTDTQMTNQMIYNEIAINDILGYFPTYMRPPYSICESACQNVMTNLGYHVVYFDLDTAGYLNDSPTLIQNSKNIWDQAINAANPASDSFLQIEHDIHQQTVYNLTDYILTSLSAHGFRSVTVGECLGDPSANWYRAGSSSVPSYTFSVAQPSATATPGTGSGGLTVSVTGSCGNGVTCQGSEFGNCCSQYGYCGSTTDYCGDGCNSGFGTCGSSSGLSSNAPVSSSTKAPVSSSTKAPASSSTKAPASSPTTKAAATPTTTSAAQPAKTTTAANGGGGLVASKDGKCGKAAGSTCAGSKYGLCCSASNKCGSSCLSVLGCQKGYGFCL